MFPGMKFSKLKETGGFKRTKGRIKQWGEVMDERLGCKQRNARVMVEARLSDKEIGFHLGIGLWLHFKSG